jgi:F-type H+-transporting ATPase subunit a
MTETEAQQHAGEAVQHVGEAVEHAAEAGHGSGDIGAQIMHHVMDNDVFDIGPLHIPLPHIEMFGQDFSITKHVVMMWLAAGVLIGSIVVAARRAHEPVPRRFRSVIEVFVLFIRDEVARKTLHGQADRYVGYLLTTFFFILACNLLGLIPGMATATGNISVTAALALIAFLQIQWGGIRENGLLGHIKHLVPGGVPLWLAPLMFVVEFLGMLVKPFALCIRLFANMMAGHVVILAFISLIFILGSIWVAPFAVAFALFINVLEVMIALIQAYIFTVLTSTFIGMSIHGH